MSDKTNTRLVIPVNGASKLMAELDARQITARAYSTSTPNLQITYDAQNYFQPFNALMTENSFLSILNVLRIYSKYPVSGLGWGITSANTYDEGADNSADEATIILPETWTRGLVKK